jgi:lysophospholipase L1-like esterase
MRRRSLTPNVESLEGRSLTSSIGPGGRSGPAQLVVCEGNSLTYGSGSSDSSTQSYPAQLRPKLGQAWAVLNFGIPALSIERMFAREHTTRAAVSAVAAQLPNTARHRTIDVVWEGTNSIRLHDTGETAFQAMAQFIALRHSQQFKVIVLTCLPAKTTEVGPDFDAQAQVYNAMIRKYAADVGADAVVDVASDRRLTDPLSAYYARDHFHLSEAGYAVVAGLVSRAAQRLAALP